MPAMRMANWMKSAMETAPDAAHEGVEEHDAARAEDAVPHGDAGTYGDEGARGEQAQGVVDDLDGYALPDEHLAEAGAVAGFDELDGAVDACAAPALGEEQGAEQRCGHGDPEAGDADQAVLVALGRVVHEGHGAEARHVKRDAADPPRDAVMAGEVILHAVHAAVEIDADAEHDDEVSREHEVIGVLQAGRCGHEGVSRFS